MALLEQPPRPKSMVDFIKTEGDSTAAVIRRCKTPTSSMYNSQPPSSKCLFSSRKIFLVDAFFPVGDFQYLYTYQAKELTK